MKKSILSILMLTITCTTQIKSRFIRGSVYGPTHNKNEQNEPLIAFLGDIHDEDIPKQREELISILKSFKPEEILVLVENSRSETLKQTNPTYCLARKNIDTRLDAKKRTSLVHLLKNSKDIGIKAINVDYRFVQITLLEEIKLLTDVEKLKEGRFRQKFSNYEPTLSINDAIDEIKNNEQEIQQFIQDSSSPISNIISDIFTRIAPWNKKRYISLQNHTRTLKEIRQMGFWDMIYERAVLFSKLFHGALNVPGHLEIKTLYHIAKNTNKKIIIIGTGLLHMLELEKLITNEKIGYKLIKEIGPNKNDLEPLFAPVKATMGKDFPEEERRKQLHSAVYDLTGFPVLAFDIMVKESFKQTWSKFESLNIANLFETIIEQ